MQQEMRKSGFKMTRVHASIFCDLGMMSQQGDQIKKNKDGNILYSLGTWLGCYLGHNGGNVEESSSCDDFSDDDFFQTFD